MRLVVLLGLLMCGYVLTYRELERTGYRVEVSLISIPTYQLKLLEPIPLIEMDEPSIIYSGSEYIRNCRSRVLGRG